MFSRSTSVVECMAKAGLHYSIVSVYFYPQNKCPCRALCGSKQTILAGFSLKFEFPVVTLFVNRKVRFSSQATRTYEKRLFWFFVHLTFLEFSIFFVDLSNFLQNLCYFPQNFCFFIPKMYAESSDEEPMFIAEDVAPSADAPKDDHDDWFTPTGIPAEVLAASNERCLEVSVFLCFCIFSIGERFLSGRKARRVGGAFRNSIAVFLCPLCLLFLPTLMKTKTKNN